MDIVKYCYTTRDEAGWFFDSFYKVSKQRGGLFSFKFDGYFYNMRFTGGIRKDVSDATATVVRYKWGTSNEPYEEWLFSVCVNPIPITEGICCVKLSFSDHHTKKRVYDFQLMMEEIFPEFTITFGCFQDWVDLNPTLLNTIMDIR